MASSSPADAGLPPRNPGRYAMLGEHGRGALGRVSRAHDLELGRDVAIKELIARGDASEARFLREALITARLEHPGIVAVHEAGRWPDGTPFYAMKLVSGRPLAELIAARTTVDERLDLLHHVIAVADAIAYAHGRSIVHRDLKPANIIVGDFGETVVIDWGLAKDLTAASEPGLAPQSVPGLSSSELTQEGSVLGTPAYMAPEQRLGAPVDQRADVYAIGVMLWELCTLSRVVPTSVAVRARTLRRAGVDRDLAAIVGKCLAPDPARRYAEAGALATDLRAFKSGLRISARAYSLPSLLTHWIRRHRLLATSAAVALLATAAGIAVYVLNITAERNRTDLALQRLETAKDAQLLTHVALLLHTNPTAALAALADYHGTDVVAAQRLRAEAEGLGVARSVLSPHATAIWFARGYANGALLTVGNDRTIKLTLGKSSTLLATNVSKDVVVARSPGDDLLAYVTSPGGFSVLDLHSFALRPISTTTPTRLAFSPDGTRIAALDEHSNLWVWAVTPVTRPILHRTIPSASAIAFATPSLIVVLARGALHTVAIASTGDPEIRALGDVAQAASIDAHDDVIVAGTIDGTISVISARGGQLARTAVCLKPVDHVHLIPNTDLLAFTCRDPVSGVARYDRVRASVTVVDTFLTIGHAELATDPSGRYLFIIDDSPTAQVYNCGTRVAHHYQGNTSIPNYIAAPTREFPDLLIGDLSGAVSLWPPPREDTRVALRAATPLFGINFTPDGAFVTASVDGTLRLLGTANAAKAELAGHHDTVNGVRVSPDGATALSYSDDRTIRVWGLRDPSISHVLTSQASLVVDAEFIEHGQRIASASEDGRVLVWSPERADGTVLYQGSVPLVALENLPLTNHVVIANASGAILDVATNRDVRTVRAANGAAITTMRVSPGGDLMAIGAADGVVEVYETATWRQVTTARVASAVSRLVFEPRGRELVIASVARRPEPGHVHILELTGHRAWRWHDVPANALDVSYASDGAALAFACDDGGIWEYSIPSDTWRYRRDHDSAVLSGRFSPDGQYFASADRRGVVVVHRRSPAPADKNALP